jgi:hypothetical protein
MVLRIGPEIQMKAYVDASFGTYEDMKSVTGIVLMIGNASVYVKSGKQKIVTRSSTEAELVRLSDALSQILWTREFLSNQGLRLGPAIDRATRDRFVLYPQNGDAANPMPA